MTQELVTGSMGRLLGSCFVALWACTLIEVGRGVCGPCPEAGTPVVSPARSHCPGCLLLSALGLESASRLTQAVDVGHGSWLLAVGEKCPDLLAHGGRSYHSSHEWRQCSGNMKCDSCGFKFSRGPCLFPGDRLDQGQKWRRHREGAGPRRGWPHTEGVVPCRGAGPRRGGGASGRGGASQRGEAMQRGWSLAQHHSSKASILRHSAFFTVQLSHPYMTTGKTKALTRRYR